MQWNRSCFRLFQVNHQSHVQKYISLLLFTVHKHICNDVIQGSTLNQSFMVYRINGSFELDNREMIKDEHGINLNYDLVLVYYIYTFQSESSLSISLCVCNAHGSLWAYACVCIKMIFRWFINDKLNSCVYVNPLCVSVSPVHQSCCVCVCVCVH